MPRTEKQYEEIRESRKAQIMDVALELFANEGYHSTSISKIAKKAAISKGLMYNYFESKEELITEIMNKGIDKLMKFFDPDHDGVLTSEEMEYLIHETLYQIKQHTDYWKLYSSAALQAFASEKVKKKLHEIMPKFNDLMIKYFEKRGLENPLGEAILFGALLDGIGFNYIMSPETYPIDEIEEMLVGRYCDSR